MSSVPVLTVVEETFPSEGARNVNPKSSVVVRLTAPMRSDAPVFDVFGDIQGAIKGHVSVSTDGKTLRFQPIGQFAAGERVRESSQQKGPRATDHAHYKVRAQVGAQYLESEMMEAESQVALASDLRAGNGRSHCRPQHEGAGHGAECGGQ